MPRRKSQTDEPFEVVAMLPPVRPAHSHHHAHDVDPYALPPGAVPGKFKLTDVQTEPQKNTSKNLAKRDELRAVQRVQAKRYNRYLDALAINGGNQVAALCSVYGLEASEVEERFEELHADVRLGIGSTDVGKILESRDLDFVSRANILKKWAYADDAGPSLKAIDMINDLSDDANTTGSFEQFLRLARASKV